MKTHPRSSQVKEFCFVNQSMEEKAMQYLEEGQKVTVTYSRPLWVNPMTCEGGLSIVNTFEEADGVSDP